MIKILVPKEKVSLPHLHGPGVHWEQLAYPQPKEIKLPRLYRTPRPHKKWPCGHRKRNYLYFVLMLPSEQVIWADVSMFSRKVEFIHTLSCVKIKYFVLDSCSPRPRPFKQTRPKNRSRRDSLQPALHYQLLVTESSADRKQHLKLISVLYRYS